MILMSERQVPLQSLSSNYSPYIQELERGETSHPPLFEQLDDSLQLLSLRVHTIGWSYVAPLNNVMPATNQCVWHEW